MERRVSGTPVFVTVGPSTLTVDCLLAPLDEGVCPGVPVAVEVGRPRDVALDMLVLTTLMAWAEDSEPMELTFPARGRRLDVSGPRATMTLELQRVVGAER
jgi:hypothetical protein